MEKQELINMGFMDNPYNDSLFYSLKPTYPQKTMVIASNLGTQNEMFAIGQVDKEKGITHLVVIASTNDEDAMTMEKLNAILYALDTDFKATKKQI